MNNYYISVNLKINGELNENQEYSRFLSQEVPQQNVQRNNLTCFVNKQLADYLHTDRLEQSIYSRVVLVLV